MSGHIKSVVLFLFVSVLISCSGGSEDPPPVVEANCDAVINLNTTDEGGQNIEVSWTTQGDYTSFEVEYGADGYTVGTGTSTTSTSNSLNITSLELDTAYDIYIRGICPSETSNWFGPLSAATICDAGSFSGDVTLTTQTEVDAFAGQCFTGITGSLIIDGEDSTEAITDLSGLVELTEITGGLIIKSNQELQNLNGLEGLQSVGFIIVDLNFNLISLEGLRNITTLTESEFNKQVGPFNYFTGLIVTRNVNLPNLTGLEQITSVTNLSVSSNNTLSSLSPLQNITTVENNLSISLTPLENLQGLNNITEANRVDIILNPSLQSLNGLEGLQSIREEIRILNNDALSTLNGLQNITFADRFTIEGNDQLTSVSDLNSSLSSETFSLKDLPALTSLTGVNISNVQVFLEILECDALIDFQGIAVGPNTNSFMQVSRCENLLTFTGLNGLDEIEGLLITENPSLENLNGFEDLLLSRNYIAIRDNSSLDDFCGLTNLVQNGTLGSTFEASFNGRDFTLTELQNGDCN